MPLKPDEIPESVTTNLRRGHTNEEPLYLSVKSPKTSSDEKDSNTESLGTGKICMQEPKHEKRQMKEMYEHKVNLLKLENFKVIPKICKNMLFQWLNR